MMINSNNIPRLGLLFLSLYVALCASASFLSDSGSNKKFPGSVSAFTVPTAFPTSVYSSYYVKAGPTNEPQPVIFDPVLNITFPFSLTDPNSFPSKANDTVIYPPALADLTPDNAKVLVSTALNEILGIILANNTGLSNNCSRCIAALSVAQMLSRLAPTHVPTAMVALCQVTGYKTSTECEDTYSSSVYGVPWTQVLSKADILGLDGRYICAYLSKTFCAPPPVMPKRVSFPKPRPQVPKIPSRSDTRAKVFHLSDLHLDTRYKVGSEANCTTGTCCRLAHSSAKGPSTNRVRDEITYPAPLFGYYKCDSPFYLALAALQSIGPLTGTSVENPPALTLYTGDLVAHGPETELSRDFIEATEDAVWQMFKAYIGGPIYAALGNHDTSPANLDSPHAIDNEGPLSGQFSWNYDHISRLWEYYSSIDEVTQKQASVHYGAYSVVHGDSLRIITLNTDFYYRNNIYAFINTEDPDFSKIFSFLIDELQKAEDTGQRVWIMGHALSGWDGFTALPNGSDMLYQIIERYSPHVIANVFWGHTHEDQAIIYYTSNGTLQTAENALTTGWVGPSITPLTNMNSGYRLYEVDTGTWEVMDAYTFYADVSTFNHLNETGTSTGPTFKLEYSTREAYGAAAQWPEDAPLNATFWHKVTVAMEKDRSLVSLFNTYQGKSSARSPNCTSEACAKAKVCYIRSGSTGLGRQCPQGFGSVQSKYTGEDF